MDKITFLYMMIEALVFIIPVATLFIHYGKKEQRQNDKLSQHDEAIKELKEEGKNMGGLLASMNNTIVAISTKLDMLIEGKLRKKDEK